MTQVRGASLRAGTLLTRVPALAAGAEVHAALGGVLSFVLVLALGADAGGYWPTAWDWSALALLFLCAVVLILQETVRLGRFETLFPGALLAFTLWGVASTAWSSSAGPPLLQSQRTLAYAAAVFAALLLVRDRSYRPLLVGVWAAITVLSGYSLLTRLFPERYGVVDPTAGYRLESPLGYWNALGIFCAIGVIVALGFVARARHPAMRALAAASTVLLVPTLYFTFSRGAWIGLAIGIATMVALDTRRLQLVLALAVVAPFPALALWRASRSQPLTHTGNTAAVIEHAGRHFALELIGLVLVAALAALALSGLERVVRVPRALRIAWATLLVLVIAIGIGVVSDRYGSPVAIAHKGYHSLIGPTSNVTGGNLNTRLASLALGERIPQWRVAWHEYSQHPWLGTGLGSYERYWNEYRTTNAAVLNVHNLYLETLAELGPVGLALLVAALAIPLVAAFRARRRAIVPAAAGAYVAFLAHATVDWDWQVPAVALAALFCGVALVIAARKPRSAPTSMHLAWRGGALALVAVFGVLAFIGLRGNTAIAASQAAANGHAWSVSAADARDARFWEPWSSQPLELEGEAQIALKQYPAAHANLERALSQDPDNWNIWLDLAIASRGANRIRAFDEASKLNPLSPEIAAWKYVSGGIPG